MSQSEESPISYVHIDSGVVRFPDICPVCGNQATDSGLLSTSIHRRPKTDFSYYSSRRYRSTIMETRHFEIPVCDAHYFSVLEIGRIRGILAISNGLFTLAFAFLGFTIIFGAIARFPLENHWLSMLGIVMVLMILTYGGLRPSALERAISIANLDPDSYAITFRVKHRWYVDELVRVNPMVTRVFFYKKV